MGACVIYRAKKTQLSEAPNHVPPQNDIEIFKEMNKCLRKFFPNNENKK